MLKKNREIFLLIIIFSSIRLVVSPFFGLGVDEAHYVLYAKYLDWSYLDHPPLVGWVHALFFYPFGTNEFLARLPAVIIFALTSYCAYLFMINITRSNRLSLLAVLALNCSFMFNVLGLMLLPDSLLLPLVFFLIFIAERVNQDKKIVYFVYLGVILGLMGLAKYTAIVVVAPLLAYYLINRRYDILLSKGMFLAALIALLMITPVIVWNIQHDFASFRYQGAHVFGSFTSSLQKFFISFGAQFGAYSPLLVIAAFYGFFKSLRQKNDYLRLAVLIGGTIIIFFLLTSFSKSTLPHWPAIFYLLFIPIGCYFLLRDNNKWKKNYAYLSIGLTLFLMLFVYVEIAGKFIKFPDYMSPWRDIYGFSDITAKADEILKENDNTGKAIAVTNWTLGSRTMYYSLTHGNDVYVLDSRKDQFDIWEKKPPLGLDLLILHTHFCKERNLKKIKCSSIEEAGELAIELNGARVDNIRYIWCRNYGGFNIER
ncbi:MAG TPA: glycosyltransferase family 39 protein [Smithellaceae bacterium]|nr:glycosyltransferase family 39 protein [Smithellaceae bacterium]HRS88255.1 glycosyltransferase family 39 protein [Smithellaceae bacterium]HRV24900.1 glycosyltransferase family 39 protein [Smithellaceae bacterium]